MKPNKLIVKKNGVLYMMVSDNIRLTDKMFAGQCETIGLVKRVTGSLAKPAANGRKYRIAELADGREFGIFSDWSAFDTGVKVETSDAKLQRAWNSSTKGSNK